MRKVELESEMRGAVATGAHELRQLIAYINDRVVPAVRAEAGIARREGACLLRACAERLDPRPTGSGSVGGRA